jgi:hypothetical protein
MATCIPMKNAAGKIFSYPFQIPKTGFEPTSKKFDSKAKGECWVKKSDSQMDSVNWQVKPNSAQ